MHLSRIVTGFAKNVEHLSDRVFSFVRPLCDLYHCLVAGLSALQFIFRDKDVVGKRTVFRDEEGIRFLHFQCADKCIVGAFQYLDHFSLGLASATFGIKGDAHLIVIHRMSGVTLGDKNRVSASFGDKRVLPVAFTLESSGHFNTVIV